MSQRSEQTTISNWTDATSSDIDVLTRQLGRRPTGVLKVAKRCRYGRPQVIVNAPVRVDRAGRARPFPTLFWLTCPYLSKAVGTIEGAGWIERMRLALDQSAELAAAMARAHEAHARLRMSLCDDEVANGLSPDERRVLETSGVGGMRRTSGVKCLHAHLADYFGRPGGGDVNVVGRETAGMLLEAGVDLDGSTHCATCSGCALDEGGPLAAIDVGSNAVRMLVAAIDRDEKGAPVNLKIVDRGRAVTRLGGALKASVQAGNFGVETRNGELTRAQQETLKAVERFAKQARAKGAKAILGVATAAVREGPDARELLLSVWERCGVSARAINGQEEAELAFKGAVRSLKNRGHGAGDGPVTVIDVGGGSTEVVGGDWSGMVRWRESVPVGAVRLTKASLSGQWKGPGQAHSRGEECVETDVRAVGEAMYREARARLEKAGVPPAGEQVGEVVAVGGAATSLAAMALKLPDYDADAVCGARVKRADVGSLFLLLSSMQLEERLRLPGLDPDRADIAPAGLAILMALMHLLDAEELTVSDGGVMHGLIWSSVGK